MCKNVRCKRSEKDALLLANEPSMLRESDPISNTTDAALSGAINSALSVILGVSAPYPTQ